MAGRRAIPTTPAEGVEAILASDRICWFPVRHFSPACAAHVQQVIEALQPDAVLIEAPDDATPLIPALLDEATDPPVSILSTWSDRKNVHGLAGVLSSAEDVPVRFRGWWPMVSYSPEFAALRAGAAVGAQLAFIDAPLPATVPFQHARDGSVVSVARDRNVAESAYFDALRRKGRFRDFDEFWQATFEVAGLASDELAFMRAVLMFAWCTRHVHDGDLEADGSLMREAHMRWHVDQARKRYQGWIVVVTGAFHSVALPWTRGKRARQKADRYTTTLLCAHSYPALSRLYGQNRMPAYGERVWAHRAAPDPHGQAASELLVEVMREARDAELPVSTADAVGGWRVVEQLAHLRQRRSPTRQDLEDAIEMAYVKGESGVAGALLRPITERVLVGKRLGSVSPLAGTVPLLGAYYAGAKRHRLDLSGAHKVVRCQIGRRAAHRRKSAFLHRADRLDLPMFAAADRKSGRGGHFRGPDLVQGTDLHLLTETWGVQWTEEVDAELLELADRGSTLAEVAESLLNDDLRMAGGDVGALGELTLAAARMALPDGVDEALRRLRDALQQDTRFLSLTSALTTLALLHRSREGLELQRIDTLVDAIARTWERAVVRLPTVRTTDAEQTREVLAGVQDIVRIGMAFQPIELDLALLRERAAELESSDAPPVIRGAAAGVLHGLGARTSGELADELGRIAAGASAADAGGYLEGLFAIGRHSMLEGTALLAAVDRVLGGLEWDGFKRLLPDLRRAFTSFTPSELDTIGANAAGYLGLATKAALDVPVPHAVRAAVAAADARAAASRQRWEEYLSELAGCSVRP